MALLDASIPDSEAINDGTETPENETAAQKPKRGRLLLVSVGIVGFLIVAAPVYAGWHFSTVRADAASKTDDTSNEILLLDTKIAKEKERMVLDIQGKDAKIKTLTEPPIRVLWSAIITELESVIRQTTADSEIGALYSFNSYALSSEGTIAVTGFTNSYPAIADLIETIEASPSFKNVKFTSTSKSAEGIVSLNLSFELEFPDKAVQNVSDSAAISPTPSQPTQP